MTLDEQLDGFHGRNSRCSHAPLCWKYHGLVAAADPLGQCAKYLSLLLIPSLA